MLLKMVGDDTILSRKSSIDLSKIPPCRDSLIPHLQRVNHRLAGYRRALDPIWEHPKPHDQDQGWEMAEGDTLQPVWSIGPILPQTRVDILAEESESDEEEDEDYICDVKLDSYDD